MDENGGSVSSNSISDSFQAASVQQTSEMISSDVPVGVNNSVSGSVKQDSKVRKKKSKKWLVVLIILVVLAGGVGGWIIVKNMGVGGSGGDEELLIDVRV